MYNDNGQFIKYLLKIELHYILGMSEMCESFRLLLFLLHSGMLSDNILQLVRFANGEDGTRNGKE